MGNNNSKNSDSKSTKEQSSELRNEGKEFYYLSNSDDDDIDRQHLHTFIIKYLFQGSFSAPVEEKLNQGCKVLDIACGPGTWLLDLASKYEKTSFYGLDIKSVFPQEIKPSNLNFIQADIFDGLPFYDNEFDFAHIESMVNILTTDQWDFVISELVRVIKPGGYIEISELYIKIGKKNSTLYKIHNGFYKNCLRRNVNIKSIKNLDSVIRLRKNIGNVHRDEKVVTFGPNGGKAGLIYQEVVTLFITTKLAVKELSAELGISEEEFKKLVEDFKEELKQDKSSKGHVIRFWAQKIC